MKIKIPRIYKLQHIAVALFVIKTFCGYSVIIPYSEMVDDILVILATSVALTAFFVTKRYNVKGLMIYGCIALLVLITSFITGMFTFAATVLTILMLDEKNLYNILSLIYKLTLFLYIAHTLYALFLRVCPEFCVNAKRQYKKAN